MSVRDEGAGRRGADIDDARTLDQVALDLGYGRDVIAQLGALWGKSASRGGGRISLLLCHLLDTAAVAELMWSRYLAPRTRALMDELGGGQGARLLMWLCGVHDCGKATPAFQAMDPVLAARVRAAGLDWRVERFQKPAWRHGIAGGKILSDLLAGLWDRGNADWVWPLVAGHHGTFPSKKEFWRQEDGEDHGRGPAWRQVQRAVVAVFTRALGYRDLGDVEPRCAPNKAEQLMLSGLVVMADWIASAHEDFPGVARLDNICLATARDRARRAWDRLGVRGGWGQLPVPDGDVFTARFGEPARPFQRVMVELARDMPSPGVMIVEAPMGEGKTKAALVSAEVLAARFGADGVFVGMPTQATSDPMFSQVRAWAEAFGPGVASQVSLLHGKRRFNAEWRELLAGAGNVPDEQFESIDLDDPYGLAAGGSVERRAPAEWFFGRNRGLLSGLVVGTIDQLLYAATRTRHVMLRFAGLAGKVVILDEVHAADIYMEQFLAEALWWLGRARVPVIVLSATVTPRQRQVLVAAYLAGAHGVDPSGPEQITASPGYPCLTAAFPVGAASEMVSRDAPGWREPVPVAVEVLAGAGADTTPVANLASTACADGGVVLIIHNTVDRAQRTFRALHQRFGDDVRLLHGRLNAAHRADRTEECLRLLGPAAGCARPRRLILVATQLAEQSFDVDADLLITDLAPIDLLLQRMGRLHRHSHTPRPVHLRAARAVVTGFEPGDTGPRLEYASEHYIYGRHRLLRTAALVLEAAGRAWSIPAEVPDLVAAVYGDAPLGPAGWADDADAARERWLAVQADRALAAAEFQLTAANAHQRSTLNALHQRGQPGSRDEEELSAVVRDGEPSVEVVLVRRRPGGYAAWNGTPIGVHGEASVEVLDTVLGGVTRLPVGLTNAAVTGLRPLDGWGGDPWLRHARALVLGEDGTTRLGNHVVSYDQLLGLVITRTAP